MLICKNFPLTVILTLNWSNFQPNDCQWLPMTSLLFTIINSYVTLSQNFCHVMIWCEIFLTSGSCSIQNKKRETIIIICFRGYCANTSSYSVYFKMQSKKESWKDDLPPTFFAEKLLFDQILELLQSHYISNSSKPLYSC